MIKKIFFLGSLVLISNFFCSQTELPINSSENKFIKKWIVAKVENLNNDSLSNLTSNTQNFLRRLNQNNVRKINLSKNLKSSISFYQLFDSIDRSPRRRRRRLLQRAPTRLPPLSPLLPPPRPL